MILSTMMLGGCLSSLLPAASAALGAAQAGVVGAAGAAQNFEYQKLKEVLARYDGLAHHSVAVVVDAPYELQFNEQGLVDMVAGGLIARLSEHVEGIELMNPVQVRSWQYTTPQWNAMAYSEMTDELQVDRVVLVDIQEFRLHPHGNRFLWEGICRAVVGVIERDGYDSDSFADAWEITARFPDIEGLDRDSASEFEIRTGVLAQFVKQTSWLFYTHLEPKHPDKYNQMLDPELDL